MATTTRNEAGTQLLHVALQHGVSVVGLLNEALATERRATVGRIRERIASLLFDNEYLEHALHILDEESVR